MSRDRTAPVLTSDVPIAPVRTCFEPTLLRGSCDTAYEVPPNATNSASDAVTLANEMCDRIRLM
jgi:hypothetical protein